MAKEYKLTHERLLEVLDGDPATGSFVWKVARSNRVRVGSRAGVKHIPSGGRYISIDNEKFMAHRLMFFYVNKRWPNTDVRPVDGDYDNCAILNLIEVSRVELAHRREKQSNNTSGYLGVSKTVRGKWQANITWNYKQISLGANFETAEAAAEMQQEAVARLKSAYSQQDCERILRELATWKGQRTAWRFLNRYHPKHLWMSFEAFCADVFDVPVMRYAMVPIDMTRPIGPGNFQWAFPTNATRTSKEGIAAHNRARRERQGDYLRDKDFRKKYGIDFAEYQRMLLAQKGVCAICEQPETKLQDGAIRMLSVDHSHTTGAVRGLLCANCNMAIGYACDDVTILEKAIAYLERHGESVKPSAMDLEIAAAMKRSPHRDWLLVATPGFGA